MNEFLLVFRRDYRTKESQPYAEVTQAHLTHWQEWLHNLAAQDLLAWPVQQLDTQGKMIGQDSVLYEGSNQEINKSIVGLIIIKATDYEAVVHVAKGCPILDVGGTVEIRQGN